MNKFESFLVVSAALSRRNTIEDMLSTEELRSLLATGKYKYKELTSYYSNFKETSFAVFGALDSLKGLKSCVFGDFGQEHILEVGSNREVFEICEDGSESFEGKWITETGNVATKLNRYLYDAITNSYYTIK